MKLPFRAYRVTVDGHAVATFSNEPAAVKVTGDLAQLVADAGGTLAGLVGFEESRAIVDTSDPNGILGTLDVQALAAAFDERETAREASAAVDIAGIVP